MRILQIIDSLETGGAERMAVNYANAISHEMEFSGLVVTRKEGTLQYHLNKNVVYLFLNKKSIIDFQAIFRLRQFVTQNKVTHIHAHSTSFFFAFLLKLTCPRIQLFWHDHYGDSEFLSTRPSISLKITLLFFNGIISVNQKLKTWAEQQLHFKNVIYLPNFSAKEKEVKVQTILKGNDEKRILCLANLREQKNHFLLIEVARILKVLHPEWSFHLVGKDFDDEYSNKIRKLIFEFQLENTIFIYGSKQDVGNILSQSTIAILTSQSEGLPVALLEYGSHIKPVVVTDVGEIPTLIENGMNGFLIPSNEPDLFYKALVQLIENKKLRTRFGEALYKTIEMNYSETTVIKKYLNWMQNSNK
ncbi:glycosyltransferase family 4 protein [Flavobacterium sp.]|uniref:glycosyltransferase family 4 protein n=1 Tax=Flavobacterium sp. TaxID=239 RepID=UPI00286AE3C5|nr:glycosyltransferase family 4 protein [Flavobacterium sp.]